MHRHEYDDRGTGEGRHHLLELLQVDGSVGPEVDHDDRAERSIRPHVLDKGDPVVPLTAHHGLDVDTGDVELQVGLGVEHDGVTYGGDVPADEAGSAGPCPIGRGNGDLGDPGGGRRRRWFEVLTG